MEKRRRPAAGQAVLALTLLVMAIPSLTACAGRATGSAGAPPASTARSFDEQEKVNRRQAEDEARRLLALAQLPPGAVAVRSAPAALAGPVVGTPGESTYASLVRFWRVPMSFAALDAYVGQHPPAGLTSPSEGYTRQGDLVTAHGYAWQDAPSRGSPRGGQLAMSVARVEGSPDASYLRVDAGSEWLDPHPIRDSRSGPRLRLESGQSCPSSARGFAGVRNDLTDDLDTALAPGGAAASGRICVYASGDGQALALLRQRSLPRAEAERVAAAARAVELAHPNDVVIHCPAMRDSTTVVVLSYPGRSAVDLWIRPGGCSAASNGHVTASPSPSLARLIDVVSRLAG